MLHRLYLLITIRFLIITAPCMAMEDASHILTELTAVYDPRQALFLTNDQVVIKGKSECSIVDSRTNTVIKEIYKSTCICASLLIHPNKPTLALYNDTIIKIYDTKTEFKKEIKIENNNDISSAYFDPLDTAIFYIHQPRNRPIRSNNTLTKLNYITGHKQDFPGLDDSSIAFHPIQPIITTCSNKNICIHPLNDLSSQPQKIRLSIYPDYFLYSPDGSALAAGNYSCIYIINPTTDTQRCIMGEDDTSLRNIRFHPHGSVLAVISDLYKKHHATISYWDIKKLPVIPKGQICTTQQLIDKTPLPSFKNKNYSNDRFSFDLHFSPDGTKIIVAPYDNNCVILQVPFEVISGTICKLGTLRTYFLLKHYAYDSGDTLPQDIAQLLTQILIETCAYDT